ncbi:MAG: hypothetical protein DRP79_00965 [Planctomycetota bacterium]|nr:MAG: hypothetical protein DRP79_00965 [Planctomycetota bacterium]
MDSEVRAKQADRRRHPRFPVPNSEVYYSTPSLPVYLRTPRGQKCPLVNMSAGGLQFISDTYLPPGRKVSLLVHVPAFLGRMIFRARVIWSKKVPNKKAYRTGVEFTRMDRESRSKLTTIRRDIAFRTDKAKQRRP